VTGVPSNHSWFKDKSELCRGQQPMH
jgi:hypothetical protein